MLNDFIYFYKILIILNHCLENSEAGWKFWQKETTTTTTPTSVQPVTTPTKATIVRGLTVPTINTGTDIANPAIDMDGARQNVRNNNARRNRPNPGTEVGLDIPVPKSNKPGISGGQNYRDWAVDFTGAGESVRTQPSRTPAQGLATSDGQTRPNSPIGHYFV